MADSLIDKGLVSIQDFPAVCFIWEKVQRWRLDKKEFAFEPPRRSEWDRLKTVIKIAREQPEVAGAILKEAGIQSIGQDKEADTTRFVLLQVLSFCEEAGFRDVKNIRQGITSDGSAGILADAINMLGKFIYEECGQAWVRKKQSSLGAVNKLLSDLDISTVEVLDIPAGSISESGLPNRPVVEYMEGEPRRLFVVKRPGNVNLVEINQNHPFVKKIDVMSGREALEAVARAICAASFELMSQDDCIRDFISYLGHNLYSDEQ